MTVTRRSFVGGAISAVACLPVSARRARANVLGLPLGIQLYSVRAQMKDDFDAALAAVAAAGFVEVEAAALPAKSAKEIRAALDKAGLRCVSTHRSFSDLANRLDEVLAFDAELGAGNVICSSPGHRAAQATTGSPQTVSLDDWRYNAEMFNGFGDKARKHRIQFGYHNHIHEFDMANGVSPYEELLKLTDPEKVTFELDCGWARVAGHNPVDLMRNHPNRFSMLHVKDFHLTPGPATPGDEPKVTELGRGDIDYKPVFAQAKKNQRIRHAFVEQEAFDVPWQESLKVDADYIKNLT